MPLLRPPTGEGHAEQEKETLDLQASKFPVPVRRAGIGAKNLLRFLDFANQLGT